MTQNHLHKYSCCKCIYGCIIWPLTDDTMLYLLELIVCVMCGFSQTITSLRYLNHATGSLRIAEIKLHRVIMEIFKDWLDDQSEVIDNKKKQKTNKVIELLKAQTLQTHQASRSVHRIQAHDSFSCLFILKTWNLMKANLASSG